MAIYVRHTMAVWSDRLAYLGLTAILAVGFSIAAIYGASHDLVPGLVVGVMYSVALGLLMMGAWVFRVLKVPLSINVSDSTVTITYQRGQVRVINIKDINTIDVGMVGTRLGRMNGITVRTKQGLEYIAIYSGYIGESGKAYRGRSIVKALQKDIS